MVSPHVEENGLGEVGVVVACPMGVTAPRLIGDGPPRRCCAACCAPTSVSDSEEKAASCWDSYCLCSELADTAVGETGSRGSGRPAMARTAAGGTVPATDAVPAGQLLVDGVGTGAGGAGILSGELDPPALGTGGGGGGGPGLLARAPGGGGGGGYLTTEGVTEETGDTAGVATADDWGLLLLLLLLRSGGGTGREGVLLLLLLDVIAGTGGGIAGAYRRSSSL